MKRRSRRSVAAVLVALALLGLCAFAVTISVQVLMDPRRWHDVDNVLTALHSVRWGDVAVLAAGLAVGVVGLVLLLAAVVPGRLVIVPIAADDTSIAAGVSRRGLAAALRRGALGVDGVRTVRIKRRRRKVVAVVRTERVATDGLAETGRAAIDGVLDHIDLGTRPVVSVRVKTLRSAP